MQRILYNNSKTKNNTMPTLSRSKLKWMDLHPETRYILLGELIDAMIYHADAVTTLMDIRQDFRINGYIKSKIMPDEIILEDTFCPHCNKKL